MTLSEAIAQQPAWVGIWLNFLLLGAFVLPLALLIWKPSRKAAVITVLASVIAAFGVDFMYQKMGYVKLLGLPHVLIWTPTVIFLWSQIKRPEMPLWPRRIMWVIMGIILISLAFDYVDVIRYVAGEREPSILPPTG